MHSYQTLNAAGHIGRLNAANTQSLSKLVSPSVGKLGSLKSPAALLLMGGFILADFAAKKLDLTKNETDALADPLQSLGLQSVERDFLKNNWSIGPDGKPGLGLYIANENTYGPQHDSFTFFYNPDGGGWSKYAPYNPVWANTWVHVFRNTGFYQFAPTGYPLWWYHKWIGKFPNPKIGQQLDVMNDVILGESAALVGPQSMLDPHGLQWDQYTFIKIVDPALLPAIHPHVNVQLNPEVQTVEVPNHHHSVSKQPVLNTAVLINLAQPGAPQVSQWIGSKSGAPPKGTKESKKRGAGGPVKNILGKVTESLDFMQCVMKSTNVHGGGWTGSNVLAEFNPSIYPTFTQAVKAWAKMMADGRGEIDPGKLASCLAGEALEDALIGKLSKGITKKLNPRGDGLGVLSGPAL